MVLGVCLAAITGCSVGPVPGADPGAITRDVEVSDQDLVLRVGDERRTLWSLDDAEGTLVHAALRPGVHDEDTVVALTRVAEGRSERYELRYLVATDDDVTDLFWFPSRLQVAEELPAILDVPPLPVWSPDGHAVAWIEWVDQGTRLRTVGWIDDGETRNPSDDASAYALADVPAGVQLEDWQTDPSGDPILLGSQDDQPYRIQLAIGDSPAISSGR